MRSVLAVVVLAVAILAPAGAASAACTGSTPSGLTFADAPADGELGLAPEILSVVAATDAACRLSVQDVLADAVAPGDLIDGDAVGIYLDTDGNPATGSALWDGADRVALVVGATGPDIGPGLGTWNGASFDFAPTPLTPVGAAGFVAMLDQLGVPASATVGIRTGAIWEGVYDTYSDFAPEVFADPFRLPVAYSTAPPPPAPLPPAPPAPAPPASPPETTRTCTVPRVKGLRTAAARRRLRQAGCRGRVVRVGSRMAVGRVVASRPGAGRRTSRTVVLRVSRGRSRGARMTGSAPLILAAAERRLSLARP